MSVTLYSFLHVASIILLTAFTFQAIAAPAPERRRRTMIVTGILGLVALVGGMGLQAKLALGWPPWLLAKLGAWLCLTVLSGLAFRRPALRGLWTALGLAAVLLAVYCVYFRPFTA